MIPPPIWTPTNAEYHDADGVSSSMLKDFISSPRYYHWRHVLGNEDPKNSRPMRIGHIVATIFDGRQRGLVVPEYKGEPVSGRNTKAFKAAAEAAANPDDVVTQQELEQAESIADAILNPQTASAEFARSILVDSVGYNEYAVKDVDFCGLKARAMVDRLYEISDVTFGYGELKTTQIHPSKWERSLKTLVADLSYDVRVNFASEVLMTSLGVDYFVVPTIIFVHQNPPHEVACVPMARWADECSGLVKKEAKRLANMLENPWLFNDGLDFESRETMELDIPEWRLSQVYSRE